MTRKYTKKIVNIPIKNEPVILYKDRILTMDEELERVEICTSLSHMLPLESLRSILQKAQEVAVNTN